MHDTSIAKSPASFARCVVGAHASRGKVVGTFSEVKRHLALDVSRSAI
jgi:hypothetical protein